MKKRLLPCILAIAVLGQACSREAAKPRLVRTPESIRGHNGIDALPFDAINARTLGTSTHGATMPSIGSDAGYLSGEPTGSGTVAIKTAEQFFYSFQLMTGVDMRFFEGGQYDPTEAQSYSNTRGRLGFDGTADSVTASKLLAITTLAGTVCENFIQSRGPNSGDGFQGNAKAAAKARVAAILSALNPGIVWSKGTAQLTQAKRGEILNLYANRFWGRDLTMTEFAILSEEIDEIIAASGDTSESTLRKAMVGVCTTMFTSPEFIKG